MYRIVVIVLLYIFYQAKSCKPITECQIYRSFLYSLKTTEDGVGYDSCGVLWPATYIVPLNPSQTYIATALRPLRD